MEVLVEVGAEVDVHERDISSGASASDCIVRPCRTESGGVSCGLVGCIGLGTGVAAVAGEVREAVEPRVKGPSVKGAQTRCGTLSPRWQ